MWHVFASKRISDARAWKQVEQQLRDWNVPFQLHVSNTAPEHDALVEDAVRSGATQFVAAGGDGATQLLVNALMQHPWETPPVVSLLPLGSGCDFARSFGQTSGAVELAAWLRVLVKSAEETSLETRTQDVDVGIAKGEWGTRYFANVASIGVTAASLRHAAGLPWLGALRYLAAFWVLLPTYGRRLFRMRHNSNELESTSILAVVANGKFFGGGFHVAPQAKLDDGILQLLIASATRVQMFSVVYQLWRGTHLRSSYVTSDQVTETRVVCDPPAEVEVDGEYLGKTPVDFSIRPRAIRIVCPTKG